MPKNKKIGYRPTWAEINLDNLEYNFRSVKKRLAPGVKTLACVKADAYGHGAVEAAKRLVKNKVDYLGVASIDEGIELRKAGIRKPILVLGLSLEEDIAPLFRHRLIPTISGWEFARALNAMAKRKNRLIKAHIKVDTGMGRIGVLSDLAVELMKNIQRLEFVKVEGLFTHLSCADTHEGLTLGQLKKLSAIAGELKNIGLRIPLLHAGNSLATVSYEHSHFNMVRPGLILYGLYPKEKFPIKLKPVLSLKTRIVYVKKLPKGYGVSYGRTYVTKKETTIVTLPIGYGDGYPRNLSNIGPVLICGRRFRICGRVCMDQIMVDVGDLKVRPGEEAVLIGSQGREKITVEELAGLANTIPYEIVCGFGRRIPRVYTP
ncbi:MAG: alanine racemase [Candidatus Omnitrophica bacterium]|jgi:alanine racemase|nr:alanine racemase [Candidatus Omnitrophota bacterium]MDD5079680.1 alanine racemase [Candidatus Omnitrophota bacterium]